MSAFEMSLTVTVSEGDAERAIAQGREDLAQLARHGVIQVRSLASGQRYHSEPDGSLMPYGVGSA